MTLPIKESSILSRGEHVGFAWFTARYGVAYRAGYVRVPLGHPWYGKSIFDVEPTPEVHGGLTFSAPESGPEGRANNGWWLSFDCGHDCDLEDPELLAPGATPKEGGTYFAKVRSQEFVEAECEFLCAQALAASEETTEQEPTR